MLNLRVFFHGAVLTWPSVAITLRKPEGGIPKRIIVTSPYEMGSKAAERVVHHMERGGDEDDIRNKAVGFRLDHGSTPSSGRAFYGDFDDTDMLEEVRSKFAAWAPNGTDIVYFDNQQMHNSAIEISNRLAASGVTDNAFQAYNSLRPMAYRADLWRYMVLWDQGGVYVDADLTLKAPLTKWIDFDKDELVLIKDSHKAGYAAYWQAMMAARPRSDILATVIRGIVGNVMQTPHFYGRCELDITGPTALHEKIHQVENVDKRIRVEYELVHVKCNGDGPQHSTADSKDCSNEVHRLLPSNGVARQRDPTDANNLIAEEVMEDRYFKGSVHYALLWHMKAAYCDEGWSRKEHMIMPQVPPETCPFFSKGKRNGRQHKPKR